MRRGLERRPRKPVATVDRARLATSRNNLANLLVMTQRFDEAEKWHRQALELRQQLVAEFPAVAS